jgi:HNH endonuclease/Homing endonuclease associated repeat
MFELKTLTDYSEEPLLAELRRVASALRGQRMTVEKFNELSRVHSSTLQKRFGSFTNAVARADIVQDIAPHLKQITREKVIEAIQAYATEFSGESPTLDEIAKRLGFARDTILRKFGKWTDLLSSVAMKPVPLGRRYSDEECFENIVALWTHYGRQPHFIELNRPPSAVGSKANVLRWGGWRNALAAFIDYVNQQPRDLVESQVATPQKPEKQDETADVSALLPSFVPRSISLALRYKILSRDRFTCTICGRSPGKVQYIELHVDHIIPWSKGGQNSPDNLRVLCFDCNLGKGTRIES